MEPALSSHLHVSPGDSIQVAKLCVASALSHFASTLCINTHMGGEMEGGRKERDAKATFVDF